MAPLCKGSCQPQRLTEGLSTTQHKPEGAHSPRPMLDGQPLRHCVPPPLTGEAGGVCSVLPPLTQGRLGGVYCVLPPLAQGRLDGAAKAQGLLVGKSHSFGVDFSL